MAVDWSAQGPEQKRLREIELNWTAIKTRTRLGTLSPSTLITLWSWDLVDINDADRFSGVLPFVFVGKTFCEYVGRHFSRGGILTTYLGVRHLSRYYLMQGSY